jgi:hypothetical protein
MEFECMGLQAQWLSNVAVLGGNALLETGPLYKACLNAALVPVYGQPPDPQTSSQVCFFVLLICSKKTKQYKCNLVFFINPNGILFLKG